MEANGRIPRWLLEAVNIDTLEASLRRVRPDTGVGGDGWRGITLKWAAAGLDAAPDGGGGGERDVR